MRQINTNRQACPSPFKQKPFGGIDAAALRLLAIILMLIDHLWATIVPGNMWMTYLGRLAFPIFAFQITEGFFHTSDRKRYGRRLLIFGLISEVPFDLIMGGTVIYPFHQNVMFTLLLGLWVISALERAGQEGTLKAWLYGILKLVGCLLLAAVFFVDYGVMGVLTVVIFYVFRGFAGAWIGQLAALILLNIVFFKGQTIPVSVLGCRFDFPTQGFAVLSLLPIWLYNGQKGRSSRLLQYGAYAFYPVHLLILYLIQTYIL